ncbi:PAS domain S-box-containing protein [Flavobacterium sp. HSC-32F16]|uniref:PAS domain-containing sensor histidine kinase n=1 Tax=Flavobacterium sp. HSC-32F16 TaxID=2910964 RepID=UPI0020A252B2|nr:ATP-binding protein [Flavobacterium sp. HSC-32F16]MCP2025172.1 PAS domain S-box-containing protein [Flavobacterium sp. HSC-32F16]
MERTVHLLRDIVDNAPLPIGVYTGPELKIELANLAMIRTWGKGSEVIGRTYIEVLPELLKQRIFDEALQVYTTGIAFHAKDRKVELVVDGQQQVFYFNYCFMPLLDPEGRIYGVMNTGMDITDLHMAKEKVQSSEEQLRMAIDASGMGTFEIDLSTQQIATSGNFRTIWNINDTITNEKIIARLHPDDIAVREKAHRDAEQTGVISYQARILNEDNSLRWTNISGKVIRDENGDPVKITGIIEDIGRQKAIEEQLRKEARDTTEELRRSNDDLQHFANLVSHDLREPVRKVKTFISRMRNEMQSEFNDRFEWYIGKIEHSAHRMQNVIEGILAYSTADKKKQPVERIDLNRVLEGIKTDLELVIQEKNAVFISSKLPEIEGARILIQQLFYNLVHNALKFSKAEVPPSVIISSSIIEDQQGNWAEISIEDNGIGLDNAYSERIFTAFERLHSKDQYEGSGLGLSLCRKIAERHGGTIKARGEKDAGSVFTVLLPLTQQSRTL